MPLSEIIIPGLRPIAPTGSREHARHRGHVVTGVQEEARAGGRSLGRIRSAWREHPSNEKIRRQTQASCDHARDCDQMLAVLRPGMNQLGPAYWKLGPRLIRPTISITEVAVTKTLVSISLFALAITVQPAFAQPGDTPAPSPLHSAPAASPDTSSNPAATQTKTEHGHRRHGSSPGSSSTGAQAPQSN